MVQQALRLGEGGVDLEGLADGVDGGFRVFLRRVGAGEVVERALTVETVAMAF